jgi:hypothetical protein
VQNLSGGLVCDAWEIKRGGDPTTVEVLSRGNKVIQLRMWTAESARQPKQTFAQLLKAYSLRKSVYSFNDPEGGGYVGFYYDDLKRGITYTGGTQDAFLLTSRPDGIIVHPRGVAPIPIEGGIRGEVVTGLGARAYKDATEAEKANQ